jgi:uncharacterized membrane protein
MQVIGDGAVRPIEDEPEAARAQGAAGHRHAPDGARGWDAATAARWEELVGGRVLGWAGGVTVLLGIVFLLVVATSRGWLGEAARVLMAAGTSGLLLAAGAWLHERRSRGDAGLAAAATGIAGLFAATVVAGPVYGLIGALPAVAIASIVGAVATALALRWNAKGLAWLGILGALGSPLLVGATGEHAAIAPMLAAYVAAAAVGIWRRWHALAFATFALAVTQLFLWIVQGYEPPADAAVVAALAVFGVVGAAAAAGFEWRARSPWLRASAGVLLALDALALAGLGAIALHGTALHLWLAGIAVAHVCAGVLARRNATVGDELALTLGGIGIVLGNVAFATVADGLPLVLGWAAGAVAFSALARVARRRPDETVALAGLAGHGLLALALAITETVPAASGGAPTQHALMGLAAVAASAWAAARLLEQRRPDWRIALDVAALVALALLSVAALSGPALALALAGEAGSLAAVARRRPSDPVPFRAALAFLFAAAIQTFGGVVPADALIGGLDDPIAAVTTLGALAVAAALTGRAARIALAGGPEQLRWLEPALYGAAGLLALYLASALVVTPFQPDAESAALPSVELGVRQQGQALLSVLWALAGLGTLVAGLVRDAQPLRLAGLALLAVTAGKVFVFDLAALDSLYRAASFVALGLLLLAGAVAWQRIRPRPLPDLRDVPGALR